MLWARNNDAISCHLWPDIFLAPNFMKFYGIFFFKILFQKFFFRHFIAILSLYHEIISISIQNNEILDFKKWNFVKFLIQIFKYLYRCFNRVRPRGGAPEFFGGATWPDRAFLSSDLKKLKLNKIDHQRKEPKRRIQMYDSLLTP